jgi:4-hydroxy-tetrahydrodipicolinate synthase
VRAREPGFRGSWVALPTPFRSGTVDYAAFQGLILRQIEAGTDGVVVAGSTGESPTLTLRERLSLVELCRRTAGHRLGVLAGIGAPDTRQACHLAVEAERIGVDGVLAPPPPYLKPTQNGLEQHYAAISAATYLPIVLYNIPTRTSVDLLPATVARIARTSTKVVAIKEAGTSLERVRELVALGAVDVLAGEDTWMPDALHAGAVGLIGVVSNLVPELVRELVHVANAPDGTRAAELVESVRPLIATLGLEPNPSPLKAGLEALGLCRGELRLPLVPVAEDTRARILGALADLGLLRR